MRSGRIYFDLGVPAHAPHQTAIDAFTAQLDIVDPLCERFNWSSLHNIPHPANPAEHIAYINKRLATTGSNIVVPGSPAMIQYCFVAQEIVCYTGIQAHLDGSPWNVNVTGSSGPISCPVFVVLTINITPES